VHWCPSRRHLVLVKTKYDTACSAGCRPPAANTRVAAFRAREVHKEIVVTEDIRRLVAANVSDLRGWKLTDSRFRFRANGRTQEIPLRGGRVTRRLLLQKGFLLEALQKLPDRALSRHLTDLMTFGPVTTKRRSRRQSL
jgi:hypothetical protein